MVRKILSLAVMAAVLVASAAGAQDGNGQEALPLDRQGRQGAVQRHAAARSGGPGPYRDQCRRAAWPPATLERALTPEERAAKDAERRRRGHRQPRHAERVQKTEEAMIASFQNEDELKRSFKIRTELLQQTLDAIEAGIGSQRASLASLLADASEAELAGTPVNAKQATSIRDLHVEMAKQQQMLVLKQGELVALDKELVRLVERFREIKGTHGRRRRRAAAEPAPRRLTRTAAPAPASPRAAARGRAFLMRSSASVSLASKRSTSTGVVLDARTRPQPSGQSARSAVDGGDARTFELRLRAGTSR